MKRGRRSNFSAAPIGDGPNALSRLVVAQRELLDMSQAKLAEKWKRTQPYVSSIENGRVWNIAYMDMCAIVEHLTVPWDVLLETMAEVRMQLQGSSLDLPDEDSGEVFMIGARGGLMRKSTRLAEQLEDAGLVGDGTRPNFRWAGVDSVPISLDDLPNVDDDPMEPA